MNNSPTTPSFVRTPRLPHMRSQRIVHVVQTEDNKDVSIVTISEDGRTEETQEIVDFCITDTENKEECEVHVTGGSDKPAEDEPIVFEVDLDDGDVQQLTKCDCEEHNQTAQSRRASLFSDDEFEPIRMKLPKRTPQPLRLLNHKVTSPKKTAFSSPASPVSPPVSEASDASSRASSLDSPNPSLDASPTLYAPSHAPYTSGSSTTLYSVASAASSATYVDSFSYQKHGGRAFCAYEKEAGSPKLVDVVTPDNVTGTRGLVDLRVYGYSFGWSRFAGRSDAAHGLRPEEAAELEIFLSKGPNAFPNRESPTRSPKKSAFEKKLFEVLKLIK
ncbi:hypothetical protein ACEPAF_5376 [Sanghuangporus sanghuang]